MEDLGQMGFQKKIKNIYERLPLRGPREGFPWNTPKGIAEFRISDFLSVDMDNFAAMAPRNWHSRGETRVIPYASENKLWAGPTTWG